VIYITTLFRVSDLPRIRLCATIVAQNELRARQIGRTMPDSGYETEQRALVEEFIPPPKPGGRPRTTNMRRVIEACLYVVKTGCQWRQLPRDFPNWRTCYGYFVEWGGLVNQQGIFRRLHLICTFKPERPQIESPTHQL
jgi:transposase